MTEKVQKKMFRILFNLAKRNLNIGYCQGMNFICFFLLEMKFSEEEVFWIMDFLIVNLIPKHYYTNMISVLADIKVLKYLILEKKPKLLKFINQNNIDLNCTFIPWFMLVFTNIENIKVL